ncbi:hypothetical protein Zmor_005179 [Zophobas morio]|uniref:Uncharacterized protein n=1 Tax=Zophobas morio TaxID=2755281 RepID=A0AA38MLR2_9CUCU|nr:hypothetical protein Zmor_005179 [Zophobas morio]
MEIRFVGQQIFHLGFIRKGTEFNRIPKPFSRNLMKYAAKNAEPRRAKSAARCANVYNRRRDAAFFSLPQSVVPDRRRDDRRQTRARSGLSVRKLSILEWVFSDLWRDSARFQLKGE